MIGAKKGLPNFNKFAMQTQVQVTRKLQFHRPGNLNTGPINEIDQMFVVGITNVFGVEAWNSYATTFPRSLRMVVTPDLTVAITNLETGKLLNPSTWRWVPVNPTVTNIPANAWPPYKPDREGPSFILPLASGPGVPYTNQVAVPAATYKATLDTFVVPANNIFERTIGGTNLHVPQWDLYLRTRLSFALIDTSVSPNRIVDYVNLDSASDPLDPGTFNVSGALCSDGNCGDFYTPSASQGAMWCTNRPGGSIADSVQTFGIMNQIEASLGTISPDWNNSRNEFPLGMSKEQAIAFFRSQFIPGGPYAQTNTFAAPYQPFRNAYKITEWQANDPLVHYTVGDLKDLQNATSLNTSNSIALDQFPNNKPPVGFLGEINRRYEPWGGNPKKSGTKATDYDLKLKDPVARTFGRSDEWDFPTNKLPNVGWLGRVHRGTPWQTLYLKPYATDILSWAKWTGDGQVLANIGQVLPRLVPVAYQPGIPNQLALF